MTVQETGYERKFKCKQPISDWMIDHGLISSISNFEAKIIKTELTPKLILDSD